MSCVHYSFFSKRDSSVVTFDGLYITLHRLRRQIMAQERLKERNCHLQISNAQTREEYTDDEAHIPKHSSVIVRRIPSTRVKPAGRTFIVDRSDTAVVGSSRPTDSSPSMSLAQLAKTANLVDANASEEDKIRAMMSQSNHEYESLHYSKKAVGPPPAHYTCYRCGKAGHYIRQCPMLMIQDKSVERAKPVRISKGIPLSFMVKAEPGTKGAMLTSTGEYVIPAIDAKAYAQGKKERPPFVPHDQSSSEDHSDPIPDELLCPVCNELMQDAAIIPCCGNSYCDDCIRTALLDSEEHICITCKQSGVSPDSLIANTFLRQVVNNFNNKTGYTKHVRKQVQRAARPPPRPPLSRPLHSRQQDPLLANVTHPPPASVPTVAPQSQVQPPAPAPSVPAPAAAAAPTPPHAAAVEGQDVSPAPVLGRGDHPPTHLHTAPSPGPAPQVYPPPSLYPPPPHPYPPPSLYPPPPQPYPPPSLYPPPPQPYPPPYISGLIPPSSIGYPPQPINAPGPPGLNPPWIPPGVQPPVAHLGPSFGASYSRSRSNSRSPFSRSPYTLSRLRSRSRSNSYSPSRSRSRSRSHGRSFPRSPYSRHNGRSYRRSRSRSPTRFHGYRHSGSVQCPPPLWAGPWEGAEGQGPFRYRSRSPGGFRSRSPGGRRPPPRELPPYELKGHKSRSWRT
ncbi:E3 ubiquitin-protein ligase RBBP6-like [Paralichthys olivaceus]|uniref:E3 ubiquitin-protein ligase RBBP6-like n=1 Tax=Paralichthys olivaceus TaxID=8255 RepID=UPI003751ECBD